MKFTKKKTVVAAVLILLVIIGLIAVFAGSARELSANKKKEIEDAWLAEGYRLSGQHYALTWYKEDSRLERTHGTRYYGTYGGYDILFITPRVESHSPGNITFADLEFTFSIYGDMRNFYAYRDGAFYSLEELYDEGLIREDEIAKIHRQHQSCEEKITELNKLPPELSKEGQEAQWSSEPVSESTKRQIEAALNADFNSSQDHDFEDYQYFGTCGDRVVFFRSSILPAKTEIEVAGYTFDHMNYFTTYVYANGKIYRLHEAYEAGLICKENIARLSEYDREIKW